MTFNWMILRCFGVAIRVLLSIFIAGDRIIRGHVESKKAKWQSAIQV